MYTLRIISGGQTGVDQAALKMAHALGIETGGWAPKGWLTEAGSALWLADYGLEEYHQTGYPPRTRVCVANADAVLWLGNPESRGGKLTRRLAREFDVPLFCDADFSQPPAEVLVWWRNLMARGMATPATTWTLMVAGNRESSAPGIGVHTAFYLDRVFRLLKEDADHA